MTTNWHDLIQRYISGTITKAETEALEQQLKTDAALRDWYLDAVNLDSALEAAAESAQTALSLPVPPSHRVFTLGSSQPFRWLSWRPLEAAAAGILFGMFCTSVVFAYAVPRLRQDRQRVMPLFNESFEDANAVYGRGFPSESGNWSGDFEAVVTTVGAVSPKEGRLMAELLHVPGRKSSAAIYLVDLAKLPPLRSTESLTFEVTASFCSTGSEGPDRNQIRLAAFAEAPPDVKDIWNSESRLERILQQLGRTAVMKPGERGWHTLKAQMEIPSGTRSLLIHLAAGTADDSEPKAPRYLDDVRAQFVITERMP